MQNNFGRGGYPGPQQQPSGGPQMAPQMKAAGGFKGAVGALAVAQKMAAQPQDTSQAGVGLMFNTAPEDPREVFVKEIVVGGSASREGTVQVGDIILAVDGAEVSGSELNKMRNLILGEIGTFATLQFLRRTPDGEELEYTISLIRGHQQYFEQLKQKSRMQEEVDKLRQTVRAVDADREGLRKQLEELEGQTGNDQREIDELRRQLQASEDNLRSEHQALKIEQAEMAEHGKRLGSLHSQKEQDRHNLEQLRGWMDQAQDKLSGAHHSLKATRQQKSDMEERLGNEKKARSEAEDIERQLINEMEEKMEEDRKFREDREQELLALEEERRKYERLLREVEVASDDEVRKRKVVEARTDKVRQQYKKIEEDNERLQTMLKEAEEARALIEQAKAETETKNKKIEEELLEIDEQSAKRQSYIEELKQKLEAERMRLEQELRGQQDGRKSDAIAFKQKEEDMLTQISKASEDVRLAKDEQEDKKRKYETNIFRLEQEVSQLGSSLKAEESLAEALRERCSVLSEQLNMVEEELKTSEQELRRLNTKLQESETEKLKALERERAMKAELEKEVDAEPEKINSIEAMKRRLEEERREKEKQLHEAKANERKAAVEKDEAEYALRRYRDDGQLLVDNERRRLERELLFKKQHEDCVAQYESTIKSQEELRNSVSRIKLPIEQYAKYANEGFVFPDTAPTKARPLDSETPQMPLQPVQGVQQVSVIPGSQGYPMLSQSMHSYSSYPSGGVVIREQHVPMSYTSSLLGNTQVLGQEHGYGPVLAPSYNGYPYSSLSSSMG